MTTITYQRMTEQFGEDELALIQDYPAGLLAAVLTSSPAVIALRGVAEVMLNKDEEKLKLLLADPILTLRWQNFEGTRGVDPRDHKYAELLKKEIEKMKKK